MCHKKCEIDVSWRLYRSEMDGHGVISETQDVERPTWEGVICRRVVAANGETLIWCRK